jgi:hypothetical protein
MGLSFTSAAPRQRSHSQVRDPPFVASYDSQGYGGAILIHLHTGNERSVGFVLFI